MNNEPNLGNEQADDGSPQELLENMPSFEEHIKGLKMQQHETGLDGEKEKEQRKRELKEKFLLDDYGKYSEDNHIWLSYESTLSHYDSEQLNICKSGSYTLRKHFSESFKTINEKAQKMESEGASIESFRDLLKQALQSLEEAYNINEETINKQHNLYISKDRIENDFRPYKIEEKYGDEVEECGISLSDINRILLDSYRADKPSIVSNGLFFTPLNENSKIEPYEYFCENLPNVIEKHFSNNVSADHKQKISSIIEKIIQNDDEYYRRDFCQMHHGDEVSFKDLADVNLSESEIDFLAKEYGKANKEAGNNHINLDKMRGGTTTNDKLLDGIMYKLYGSNYSEKFIMTGMQERVEKYMQ